MGKIEEKNNAEGENHEEIEIMKRIKETALGGFIVEQWGKLTAIIPGRKTVAGKFTPEQLEILDLIDKLSPEERKKIIALLKSGAAEE